MKNTTAGLMLAVAAVSSIVARADVEWKWDESRHVAATPITAEASVSDLALPLTAKAADEGFLSSFCYLWTESAPFRLTGGALGFVLVFR